ncbi:ldehyde reductase 1 [Diaporthe amygdali]|uniref:ldehyde reductase 1 n=1 Tax=Phomopsis amygdali TaxID=1214568 RepID=UPI0022FE6672|nr:ldehyde reductase 1 [Diaporthe amygdali]KAJ0119632.1 ldehyde reductase 1 [Diaporthe amygdali]
MTLAESFKFNNGLTVPAVGLGTWQSKPNEVKNAVELALKSGYRHVDAAAVYDNEKEVGEGIKASGIPRKDIFLTSKLWNTHHKGEDVEKAVDISLADLQTDYLDLYLIHWPVSFRRINDTERFPIDEKTFGADVIDVPIIETWRAMEALVKKGKIRTIGVSNFSIAKINEIWDAAEIKPAVNQVELHPYFAQPELVKWCQDKGIVVEAYSPLGNNIYSLPMAIEDPTVIQLAEKLGKTPGQVVLSWVVQRGIVVLTKSVTPSRIKSNLEVFELPADALEKVNSLDRNHRYNLPARLGVDIFGDAKPEVIEKAVAEFKKKNRQARGLEA